MKVSGSFQTLKPSKFTFSVQQQNKVYDIGRHVANVTGLALRYISFQASSLHVSIRLITNTAQSFILNGAKKRI